MTPRILVLTPRILALASLLAVIATSAHAQNRGSVFHGIRGSVPSVVAPYRSPSAPGPASPADQQETLGYRAQLQGQIRDLQNLRTQHQLDALGHQELNATESELNRVNGELHP